MSTSTPDATAQVAGHTAAHPSRTAELAGLKVRLRAALRQFPDFPSPGILFEDILPIFADPTLHEALLRSLELHILASYDGQKPDVIVGLEARGFLIGPSLALRLGASFVPVRKQGKLPGPCETQSYEKEYGQDFFQMQADSIKPGQKVIVVDDIIATGWFSLSLSSLFIHNTDVFRWLRMCLRRTDQEDGRRPARLHFHSRAGIPQGTRQAAGPSVHASHGPSLDLFTASAQKSVCFCQWDEPDRPTDGPDPRALNDPVRSGVDGLFFPAPLYNNKKNRNHRDKKGNTKIYK